METKRPAEPTRQPRRTCVGCRTTLAQSAMIRCALSPEGVAIVSRTAPGRGAWLCAPTCFTAAVKRKGFERAWRQPLGAGALAALRTAFVSTCPTTEH